MVCVFSWFPPVQGVFKGGGERGICYILVWHMPHYFTINYKYTAPPKSLSQVTASNGIFLNKSLLPLSAWVQCYLLSVFSLM